MQDRENTVVMKFRRVPWNKARQSGQNRRFGQSTSGQSTKLQVDGRTRDLAMFNLAIDSKLRGCDVVTLKVEDVAPSGYAVDRATAYRQSARLAAPARAHYDARADMLRPFHCAALRQLLTSQRAAGTVAFARSGY